jgi:hypothetical protein
MGLVLFVIAVVQFIRDPANLIDDFIGDEPDNPAYDGENKHAEHDVPIARAIPPSD